MFTFTHEIRLCSGSISIVALTYRPVLFQSFLISPQDLEFVRFAGIFCFLGFQVDYFAEKFCFRGFGFGYLDELYCCQEFAALYSCLFPGFGFGCLVHCFVVEAVQFELLNFWPITFNSILACSLIDAVLIY